MILLLQLILTLIIYGRLPFIGTFIWGRILCFQILENNIY